MKCTVYFLHKASLLLILSPHHCYILNMLGHCYGSGISRNIAVVDVVVAIAAALVVVTVVVTAPPPTIAVVVVVVVVIAG